MRGDVIQVRLSTEEKLRLVETARREGTTIAGLFRYLFAQYEVQNTNEEK